jgi:hypothetical protein
MSAVVKAVKKVAKAVTDTVKRVVNTVVDTAKAIIKDPLPTLVALAGQAVGIPAPVTMAAITGARGGDLGDMAKAATIAYVAPQAASKVAAAIAPTVSSTITNQAAAKAVTAATSKALVNGTVAAATGGDFGEAAAGTMAGSLAASGYQNFVAPSVMEKAQEFGLDVATAKNVSAGLRTGVAAGTATAVSGGDFVAGFATAVADYGIEEGFEKAGDSFKTSALGKSIQEGPIGETARKVSDVFDSVTDSIENAFKKKDVATSEPLGNGVPTVVANEVPVSPNAEPGVIANADGKTLGTINPASNDDIFNQIVAAFEEPRSSKFEAGVPTAALEEIGGEKLARALAGSGTVTDEPLFAGAGFNVGTDQTASPISNITVDGKNYQTRDVSDATGKTTYYFDPADNQVTAKPKEFFGTDAGVGDVDEIKSLAPIEVTAPESILPERQALKDLTSLYKASTGSPLLPSTAPSTAPSAPPVPTAPSLPELKAVVDEAKSQAIEAAVAAQVLPTPENVSAARDAQLNAELAQSVLDEAAQKTSLTPPPLDSGSSSNLDTTLSGQVSPPMSDAATTFTPPTAVPSTEAPEGPLQPSTIGGMIRGDEQGVTGGLSTLSPEASGIGGVPGGMPGGVSEGIPGGIPDGVPGSVSEGVPGGLPSGLPGIIRGGDGTGLLDVGGEGISQLPPVEVIGELLPEDERYRVQRPPSATQQDGSGGGGGGGALNAGQFIRRRRSPLASLLPNDQGLLGDLGSGVVFIEDLPYQWLQPSALARGGLIRFKKA